MYIIHNILLMLAQSKAYSCILMIPGKDIFGVSTGFLLLFFGKLLLLMAFSVIISKLLKLDKTYDELQHHRKT